MNLFSTIFLSILLRASSAEPSSQAHQCLDISEAVGAVKLMFHDARIPEELNIKFEPRALFNVAWPPPKNAVEPIATYPGRHLIDNSTFPTPIFTVKGLPRYKKGPSVIVVVDPDAPTPENPIWKSIRHFTGSDFYLNNYGPVLKNQTAAIIRWHRPTPVPQSREHRYIFLLYEQPTTFDNITNLDGTSIRNFDVADYAQKVGLGDPIAGTFVYIKSNASCWEDGCK